MGISSDIFRSSDFVRILHGNKLVELTNRGVLRNTSSSFCAERELLFYWLMNFGSLSDTMRLLSWTDGNNIVDDRNKCSLLRAHA